MNRYRYAIRTISPISAFLYGLVLGAVVMVLPGLLLGAGLRVLVAAVVEALSGGLFPPDLGPLRTWYEMGWGLTLWVAAYTVVSGAVLTAISTLLGALVYDLVAMLTGGLVVTTVLLDPPTGAYAPAAGAGASLPAPLPASLAPSTATWNPTAAASVAGAQSGAHGTPAPVAAGGAWLALAEHPAQRWPVHAPVTTIGSGGDCDISLAGLATRHAEVRFENGRYIFYDLSGGQSWVNGRQINGANMLKDGFQVHLGNLGFVFQAS